MIAIEFYKLCKKLKLNRDQFDQIKRASASICRNLSEGYSKPTYKDQRKFYYISLASMRECEGIILMEEVKDEEPERAEVC